MGLVDIARHTIGCHLTQETRFQNTSLMPWRAISARPYPTLVSSAHGRSAQNPVLFQDPGRAVQVDRGLTALGLST